MSSQNISPLRRGAQRIKKAFTSPEKWAYASGLRSPKELALPDFLGIGAQKAGSTWLHEMLRLHPELFLPQEKEVHYFDRRFHRTLHYYTRRFVPAGNRVKGEITPDYSNLSPEMIRFIRRVMPDLKLVYLIRNPVERAWSQAQREVLRARKRQIHEVDPAEFYAHFNSADSRAHCDYVGNMERWLAEYPKERLWVGFTHEIRERPEWVLAEVFRHLGVSTDVDWETFPTQSEVNRRGKVPMPHAYREYLMDMYAGQMEQLHRIYGQRVERWITPAARVQVPAIRQTYGVPAAAGKG